ncbi:MAG: inositol monophosphatase [Candidatus Marinimicrobia bacterium]|nr:inositol monophosphatase [Candidatus Neomarinimicrobiota bacterium]|tara:strand:- start:2503 stop:3303 length:801 start_codon:yes stop_codon:yes gene_type:complete
MSTKEKLKNNLSYSIFFNSICKDISNLIKSNNIRSIEEKSYKEWVTNIDYLVEDFVIKKIKSNFPDSIFISEERSNINKVINSSSSFTWIIDPIDGTNNLIKDYPFYAVSICGLIHDEMQIGCVYDISRDEFFYGEKDKGAYLNGNQLSISNTQSLQNSIVATGFVMSKVDFAAENFENLKKIFFKCKSFRRLGSASLDLAYLAAGRIDGCWYKGLEKWDFAAGCLLVTEAGGRISSFKNKEFSLDSQSLIASNSLIHDELSNLFD